MGEYAILVGHERPPVIKGGFLEKGSGQTIVNKEQVFANRRGDVGIPNRSESWGVRLINGQVPKDDKGLVRKVSVTDPEYKGEVKWLKRGHPDGTLIVTRYLKGYQSIDMMYQDIVLNAKMNINDNDESSADAFYLRLPTGLNVFKIDETDPFLIEFLKVQDYNGSSVSKSDKVINWLFVERNEEQIEEEGSKAIDAKLEILKLVQDASLDNTNNKLRNLYAIVKNLMAGEAEDVNLYKVLQHLADAKPAEFLQLVTEHKRKLSDSFEKAKSYNLLDLTRDGTIAISMGANKKELIDKIPGKGDKMLSWVFENFLDAKAHEVSFQLNKALEKIK